MEIKNIIIRCDNEPKTPPFNFLCYLRIIDAEGNSLLSNKGYVEDIKVSLEVLSSDRRVTIYHCYLPHFDYIQIQISEFDVFKKNNGNYEQDYVIKVQTEEILGQDYVIRAIYKFKDYKYSLLDVFINNEQVELDFVQDNEITIITKQ
jgi:hypothetical protein